MRTKAEVIAAQNSVYGCCDRHANNMACSCLYWAIGEEVGLAAAPPEGTIPPHSLSDGSVSPEMMELARLAVLERERQKMRTEEDWALRIARDVANATD